MKEKELVTLRSKLLKTGSQSLYLDYMIDGVRYKDYLKMYLVPERTKLDARLNEETTKIAQAAKAKKILEIQSGKINLKRRKLAPDVLFTEYVMQQSRDYIKRGSVAYGQTLEKISNWVEKYHHRVSLRSLDKEWIKGFVRYLQDNGLAGTTIHMYFCNLNTILNRAFRADLIPENPILRMETTEKPQRPETEREYLTLEEVQSLMTTPCKNDVLRRAFLFACFTGLRLSDIENLRWENIKKSGDGWQVEKRQIKTKKIAFVPLSDNAMAMLPERKEGKAFVWKGLPNRSDISRQLRSWMATTGIDKHISFHCTRHTNATLLLTYGADIYTVSSLLGHTDIATTQIYAKIINEKKVQAVNMIPKII